MAARHGENPDPDYYLMFPGHRLEISDRLIESLAETMYQKDGGSGIPAGYTYFGQFLAHDMTHFVDDDNQCLLDQLSTIERKNCRTPSLDLDSLYGHPSGFGAHIESKAGKFINKNQSEVKGRIIFFDLPRDAQGVAQIGDKRNDENLFVAQMHLLFMNAHNRLVDLYTDRGVQDPFREAREELTLIFQRLVRDDFLYRILNRRVFNKLFRESNTVCLLNISQDNQADMRLPYEFSAAAFRFGHSMVRSNYKIRVNGEVLPQSISQLFKLTAAGGGWQSIRPDLFSMAWDKQVDFSRYQFDNAFQETEMIDSYFISEMRNLPMEPSIDNNIIVRNLKKARELGMASGQSIIKAIGSSRQGDEYCAQMGLEVLDFSKVKSNEMQELFDCYGLRKHMPLWTYILIEPAQYFPGHDAHARLGTLGSLLLGEVFRALLLTSRTSLTVKGFAASESAFMQDIKSRFPNRNNSDDDFGLEDLVAFVNY